MCGDRLGVQPQLREGVRPSDTASQPVNMTGLPIPHPSDSSQGDLQLIGCVSPGEWLHLSRHWFLYQQRMKTQLILAIRGSHVLQSSLEH